jgi:hypothetical protein
MNYWSPCGKHATLSSWSRLRRPSFSRRPGKMKVGRGEEMLSRIMSRGMRQIGTADLILDRLMSVEMLYAAHDVLGAVLPTNC